MIAVQIGRSASSVSREIARNGGRDAYRATDADAATWERSRRPKASKLDRHEGLRELVRLKLTDDWSPEQIAWWLRRSFPDEPEWWISLEAIYRHLYIKGEVGCGTCSPSTTAHRRSQTGRRSGIGRETS